MSTHSAASFLAQLVGLRGCFAYRKLGFDRGLRFVQLFGDPRALLGRHFTQVFECVLELALLA